MPIAAVDGVVVIEDEGDVEGGGEADHGEEEGLGPTRHFVRVIGGEEIRPTRRHSLEAEVQIAIRGRRSTGIETFVKTGAGIEVPRARLLRRHICSAPCPLGRRHLPDNRPRPTCDLSLRRPRRSPSHLSGELLAVIKLIARYSPSQPTSVISISDDEETAVAAMDVPAGTAARVQGATDRIGSEGVTPDPPRPPRFKPRNHNVRENDPAPPPVLEREPSPPPPEPPKFKPRNHNPRKNDPQPNPTPPPPLYLHQHSTTSSIPPNNPSQNISNHEPIPIPSSSVQEDVKPDISTLETAESESSSSREGSPSKEGVMWIKYVEYRHSLMTERSTCLRIALLPTGVNAHERVCGS